MAFDAWAVAGTGAGVWVLLIWPWLHGLRQLHSYWVALLDVFWSMACSSASACTLHPLHWCIIMSCSALLPRAGHLGSYPHKGRHQTRGGLSSHHWVQTTLGLLQCSACPMKTVAAWLCGGVLVGHNGRHHCLSSTVAGISFDLLIIMSCSSDVKLDLVAVISLSNGTMVLGSDVEFVCASSPPRSC